MFIEINNLIDVKQTERINGWFAGISESTVEGSFLVHHFLSHSFKSSTPVCFVALSQSFGHYNVISQKFGTNLSTQKETNKLVFVEGLKLLGNTCCKDCDKGDNSVDDKSVLINLLQSISTSYKDLKEKNCCSPTIIIDNISVLIALGFSTKDVITFCHYLHEVIHEDIGEKGCLVLYANNGKHNGDEQMKIVWNWMCHNCTVTMEVSGLPTGYCKDVHGEIAVKHRHSLTKPGKERRMQYKLTDKNIILFAAGMSSAVL
ncbi:unnamed protein product [Mytilus coruscus]|uniref:Elongator complex protein 6 n=1 Tax=Mytilus coruscus TaxID=42192 RepID=A0A6J8B520_MYTCO|nr:unnamed protein product [Mytilus coruscus]